MTRTRLRTLAAGLALVWVFGAQTALAAGGSVTPSFTLTPGSLQCGGHTTATLTIDGQSPPPGTQPVDVMLTLDVSGSMGGQPIADMRTAATSFVNIMDAGDGASDGTMGSSRVGMVSFSDVATLRAPLTHSASAVNSQISGLVAGGNTNISHGIDLSQSQLGGSAVKRVMVLMTDGQPTRTNRGGNPVTDAIAAATAAKAAGTELYTIGLGTSVSESFLRQLATDNAHYYRAPTSADLQAIFTAIAQGVAGPAATGMQYSVQAAPGFAIAGAAASAGTVTYTAAGLTWDVGELRTQTVSLSYTLQHTGGTDGARPVQTAADLTYTDDDGNVQTRSFAAATVQVDGCNQPPVANAGADQSVAMTGAAGATVTLDGSASTDDGQVQPLSYTWYEGATLLGTGPTLDFTFPLGAHNLTLVVFDGVYSASDTVTVTVEDRIAPVTTITVSGTAGNAGWYVSPVTVDVSAADNPGGSGVDFTTATLDGSAFAAPALLAVDGVYTAEAHSTDRAGNVEAPPATLTVSVDQTAPTTAASLDPAAASGSNGWYNGPVSLTLTASDAKSGVAGTEYQVNGGAWEAYTGAVAFAADGVYTVAFRSHDVAGNQEADQSVTFQVDATAPTVTVAAPAGGTYSIADVLTVGYTAADAMSGVDTVVADLDGAAVTDGQAVQLWTLAPGAHTFTVTATDRAGNSQTRTVTFTVAVTYDGLEQLKHWFADHGYIDNQGVVNSLDQKLRAARAAHERGQHETEDNILRAFIAEVQAQTGKHIFEPAGSTLASWAQTMIDSH